MKMANRIEVKINDALHPEMLEVKNISHLHEGHAGHDGSGESHFIVKIVSDAFEGLSRVQRHRLVYDLLGDEFGDTLHALSVKASTPAEQKD